MPYDSTLDQQLFTKEWGAENNRISVSVYSYKNGPRKLQISREVKDREGNFIFARLGRLAKEELEGILPLISEAMKIM